MTNKLSKCPRGAAILKNRKAAVGSWDLGTDLARLRKISDELTQEARSVQPKFPEISVQNSMDRFYPTGRVFEKTGPPHFSQSDWSEFWLNESRRGIKVLFLFLYFSFVLLTVIFCFIINVSWKRLNSILPGRVACSSTRKPRNTLNCI